MTMDRTELLRCMRDAAEALAEFRRFIPVYFPEASTPLERALRHFDIALNVCERGGDDDDDDNNKHPRPRITW